MYPAHITYINGERCEQSVYEHCRNTAQYAAASLKSAGLYNCGYFVGLIHDIGKLSHKFAEYISRAAEGDTSDKGKINHTFAAVIYILERYHTDNNSEMEKMTAELLAWVAASHHGLVDLVDTESKSGFAHRLNKDRKEICYDEVIHAFGVDYASADEIDAVFASAVSEINDLHNKIKMDCIEQKFSVKNVAKNAMMYLRGMMCRLILSALIDGDRRDTAEFMTGEKFVFAVSDSELWRDRLTWFDNKVKCFCTDTPINAARKYISDSAYDFAFRKGGIYRITVPTGAGKTLSTLRYALAHSLEYDKCRLIFVIPLLSVLEQNAAVLREYVGDESIVTEHHSNVVKCSDDREELDEYELLSQTWETPVLITTLVQLLNTLFSGKTTAVRRMKSLCNSVIVIDEVQTVPHKLLYMFNEAINFLAYYCNATVILSSATQPCFEAIDYSLAVEPDGDIVPYDEQIFSAFDRTEIVDKCTPYGMSIEELADFSAELATESENLLVICNTKKSVAKLYNILKTMCGCKIFHLSNNMCMQHRKDTLAKINACLSEPEKIICVSSQLVEAGVDFSFESCIRVKAGIDNVAQAAGRCNRSNDYKHICKVYIVSLRDENLSRLKEIKEAQDCSTQFLYNFAADKERYKNNILSNESVSEYYHLLFGGFVNKSVFSYPTRNYGSLFELLSRNADFVKHSEAEGKFRINQAFKTAGKLFEVFDSETTDVIVPYNDEAEEIIKELCSQKARFDVKYLNDKIEAAKPYMIHIFSDTLKNKDYMLYSDEKGHFTALHKGFYNPETGLDENNTTF